MTRRHQSIVLDARASGNLFVVTMFDRENDALSYISKCENEKGAIATVKFADVVLSVLSG